MTESLRRRSIRFLGWRARDAVLLVALVLCVQVGLVQAFHVPTGSMETTVLAGERILTEKVTLGPRTPDWIGIPFTGIGTSIPALKLPGLRSAEPGDVVVIRTPENAHIPFVKRVVAVGGQTVEIRDKTVYVDGAPEPYADELVHRDPRTFPPGAVQEGIPAALGNRDNWGPYRVPDGDVFLMGDNRDESLDSRYFGPVPADNVIGLARAVYFSWKGGPRWNRIGHPL
jgi:signal peptidase I